MALRGNLKELSLPDIFQLVTFSGKTGVLRIHRPDDAEGSVWFRDGDVFFAQSNWRTEPIGERLVRAQRITPMALERALELRSEEPEGGKRLGEILVEQGYITDKVLEAFVQEQMQDTIFDLMRWDEGDFEFQAMPEAPEEDIGLAVSIENVIMEGSRRLDEWNRIKKKIPSVEVVFKMATAPGEGTFEISLKPIEWNLLLLVDGSRSVAELATETNRTDFEVARILYGLFSAGLLEFANDEDAAAARAERMEREARLAEIEAAQAAEDAKAKAAEEAAAKAQVEADAKAAEAAAAQATPAAKPKRGAKAAVVEPASVSTEPVEEPEFLGAGAAEATPEDLDVLNAAMGALLQPAPAPKPTAKPEPVAYAPAEEPAFIAASQERAAAGAVGVPNVEDLIGDIEGLRAEPALEPELVAEPVPAAVAEPVPAPEPVPMPEPKPVAVPAGVAEVEPVAEPVLAPEAEPVAAVAAESPVAEAVAGVGVAAVAGAALLGAPEVAAAESATPAAEEPSQAPAPAAEPAPAPAPAPEPELQPDFETVAAEPQPAPAPELEPDIASVAAALEELPAVESQPAPSVVSESVEAERPFTPGSFVVVPDAGAASVVASAEPAAATPEAPAPLEVAAPAAVTPAPPTSRPVPGLSGFEHDLMALGLGELPLELQASAAPPQPVAPSAPVAEAPGPAAPEGEASVAEPLAFAPPVAEPAPLQYETPLADEPDLADLFDLEPISEPMSIAGPADANGATVQAGPAAAPEGSSADFSALLESLDISADDAKAVVPPEVETGAVATLSDPLLQAPAAEQGGVISTDAFMDEIAIDHDFAFSGELNDELSALTGADRPARPSASVNQLPAEGEGVLHRDSRVDRDTLLKIIDGIKNL